MYIDYGKPAGSSCNNVEFVETYITLPMRDEVAGDILKKQAGSKYAAPLGEVGGILGDLARLQGFQGAHFLVATEEYL